MSTATKDLSYIEELVAQYPEHKGGTLTIMQKIQEREGCLSPEALDELARCSGVSVNELYGVATFYSFYKFSPPGKHTIQVCLGTACHVRGGAKILAELERLLGIKVGEVTADGKFGLVRIACLGCCALEPVIARDGKFYPRVSVRQLPSILAAYQDQ